METREQYKEFSGRNIEQMPALISEGRVPMSVSQLMQKRLDNRSGFYVDDYFDEINCVLSSVKSKKF